MSRPLRIQYEGACYHVSNKGAGNRPIVTCDAHRKLFIALLQEIHEQYQAEIHAWCLLDNCYHLLMETPKANLSKVMRHLNGVYTQKFNRLEKTDGALFKGRYKSILIDPAMYLAHVGRRIHMTPMIEKIVKDLSEYIWSSYYNYMGLADTPEWLQTKKTSGMLKDFGGSYEKYMSSDEDVDVVNFYAKKTLAHILGSEDFGKSIQALLNEENSFEIKIDVSDKINATLAIAFGISVEEVHASVRGNTNIARLMSIYLHHTLAETNQNEIARIFSFKQAGSVGSSIYRYKKLRLEFPEIKQMEEEVIASLGFNTQRT